MTQLTVLATTPSPYQAELFDAVASGGEFQLRVIYMVRGHADRLWEPCSLKHEHLYWTDGPAARDAGRHWTQEADLAIFAWYAEPSARSLIRARARTGRPWVYWGERPGFRGWQWLGRMRRRVHLAPLHSQPVPIWGMGSWAVQGWRQEFGQRRQYHNVPYFSDLTRFAPPDGCARRLGIRRFLFSGALIARKGVDLLAEAFATVARTRPNLRLDVIGHGALESTMRRQLANCLRQVQFRGFCQWDELPIHYHVADLLVAPSRYDGWGMIVPEGLAAGLPVIATDRMGAALELIRPTENGWLVAAGDLAALTAAMEQAADLPDEKLAELSSASLASVANHTLDDGVRRFSQAAWAALGRSDEAARPVAELADQALTTQ